MGDRTSRAEGGGDSYHPSFVLFSHCVLYEYKYVLVALSRAHLEEHNSHEIISDSQVRIVLLFFGEREMGRSILRTTRKAGGSDLAGAEGGEGVLPPWEWRDRGGQTDRP